MWLEILFTLFLILLTLYMIIPYEFSSKEVRETLNTIPGPKGLPIFGNFAVISQSPDSELESYNQLFLNFGSRVKTYILGHPALFLKDIEDIQVLLSDNRNISKDVIYIILKGWLGDGLLLSSGTKWFKHRKLLTSAFHFKILEHHEEISNQNADIFIQLLEKHALDGKPFEIFPYIMNLTLDIMCESAMGLKGNSQIKGNEYVEGVKSLISVILEKKQSFWLMLPFTYFFSSTRRKERKIEKIVHNFTDTVIQERKKQFANNKYRNDYNKKKRLSFLDLLLDVSENDSSFSSRDIREEVDTFMFEGFDTTATALNWCVFLLGNHPDIQEDVIKEVDFANQCQEKGEKLRQLQLLERVIKETLRLYPSVPIFSRKLSAPLELDGVTIPPGVNVPVFTYLIHRDPRYYPDPYKFDPNRFLPIHCEKRNPFSYIPFSAGPRNCIGQKFAMIEMKLVIAALLSKYRIKSLQKPEDIGVLSAFTLKPDRPLLSILIKRDDI